MCEVDQAVFLKRTTNGLTIVLVHVNDCTIVASTLVLIEDFLNGLAGHVEISDEGKLHWILGIEVRCDRE